MNFIRRAIRHFFLYHTLKNAMIERSMRKWTEHDQKMFDFYRQFINPGDLCFDVGANMGNRTKVFLRLGAVVVAVEPQDKCMSFLRKHFRDDQRVNLVEKALGEVNGEAEMMISDEHAISSLSKEWINKVRESGRFSEFRWPEKQIVRVTTIDSLIEQHGIPSFIKIDVEGYEYQVIKGLTRPVHTLSFEFTPEFMDASYSCIEWLSRLGETRWNYSFGETMELALKGWTYPENMIEILSRHRNDKLFGDVYVRFQN